MHNGPLADPITEIPHATPHLSPILLTGLIGTAIDITAAWLLGHVPMDLPARIAVALAPLPANLTLLVLVLRAIRRLDEFQKRVHFEAVVVAFLATGLATFIYGYLQKAQAVGPFNVLFIWAFMVCFYGVGYAVAIRHYR